MEAVHDVINRIYKTESAKVLAVLTRVLGVHNLSLAEDVVQETFSKGLHSWQKKGVPIKPEAWIMQTAKNLAIDTIRANKTKLRFAEDLFYHLESEWSMHSVVEAEFQPDNIKDDQLRMILMCCHENVKAENKLPFILKTLCGFDVAAVARAMVLPEATVKKRLLRTRQQLRGLSLDFPSDDQLPDRLSTVNTVLYLLFNEGFHSSHPDRSVHIIFCQEAIGLMRLLIDDPRLLNIETLALFALMHFHIARIDSRLDDEGVAIPIDLQNRTLWKGEYIQTAHYFMQLAIRMNDSVGGQPGRFLSEALIASEHCCAKKFSDTRWSRIVTHYQQLIEVTGSPLAELNQAVAIAYAGDVERAIETIERLESHALLRSSNMPTAMLAHLHAKKGDAQKAHDYASQSKKIGGTPREHLVMMRQIERLLSETA